MTSLKFWREYARVKGRRFTEPKPTSEEELPFDDDVPCCARCGEPLEDNTMFDDDEICSSCMEGAADRRYDEMKDAMWD